MAKAKKTTSKASEKSALHKPKKSAKPELSEKALEKIAGGIHTDPKPGRNAVG